MKQFSLSTVVRTGVYGALAGSAAGLLVGLLVAPEQGGKMRRRLAYRLERFAGQVGGYVERLAQDPALPNEARETAEAVVADAEAEARRIRSEIDRLIQQQRTRAASEHG